MFDIVTGAIPKPLARQMAKFAKAAGNLEKYVPTGSDWSAEKLPFENNNKTSDPARFENSVNLVRNNDMLRNGEPTYGWIYETFKSIDILNHEEYLKEIKTPILMEISGREEVVDKEAQERAIGFLPDCHVVRIPDAKHEIWSERDELRGQWLAQAAQFLDERSAPPQAAPKKPKPPAQKPPGL
jgi:lysophospholipase